MDAMAPDGNVNDWRYFQKHHNLTQAGAQWLTVALDVFHDTSVPLEGYPDADSGHSQILVEKSTANVSCPGAAAWDCNVFTLPEASYNAANYGCSLAADTHAMTFDSTKDSTALGTFNIWAADSGELTTPSTGKAWAPTNFVGAALPASDDNVTYSRNRVIAAGFEVVNTSAPLNRQGMVTVYRHSQQLHDWDQCLITSNDNGPNTRGFPTNYRLNTLPPSSIEAASRLPSSRQWSADQGAYCMGIIGDRENAYHHTTTQPQIFLADPSGLAAAHGVSNETTAPTNHYGASCVLSLDTVGAYFTNLGADSTLRVNTIRVIERQFPPSNASCTLMTPAAVHDPAALDLYFKIVPHLLPGVPVGMNPKGEFWRMIKQIARDLSPILDKTIFGGLPVTETLNKLLFKGAKTVSNVNVKPRKTKMQPLRITYRPTKPKTTIKTKKR
jgi:hypothetical protein